MSRIKDGGIQPVTTRLILSRKTGQSVRIGDKVHVTVNQIRGKHVSLMFVAPPDVPIHRTEVFQRIAASSTSSPAAHA
jgi:carbon storage regulator